LDTPKDPDTPPDASSPRDLSIIVPAFNEADRLPKTLAALLERFPDDATEIIVVDDGSDDETTAIATRALAQRTSGRVITLPGNCGKGKAVRTGVGASVGATVLIMDADLATNLDAFDFAARALETADVAVGSRAVPGSHVNGTSPMRAAMGRTFNRLVRLLTPLDVHDSQCGFKVFHGDVARLVFSLSRDDGFAFDPEVLLIAHYLRYRIAEFPVTWTAVEGSSVRPVRDSLRTGASLVRIALTRRASKIRAAARRRGWPELHSPSSAIDGTITSGARGHVVFVAWRDLAHPQAGGSEIVVDQLARGLQERGFDITLLTGGPLGVHSYEVERTGGTYSQYLGAPLRFHREQLDADVVVDVENGIPFFSPAWQGAPVVCLVHHVHTRQWAMQFSTGPAAIGRWLESSVMPRVYKHSDYVAVSTSTANELAALGVAKDRITTIEMGLEPIPTSGVPSPTPRFLILGRLVPHKRVDLALRLWSRVRAETGGELVVVGDGPEMERLRDLAPPDVIFTGAVDEWQKGEELGKAWILVHPAHHEGWGTVVMEAAAAGVPTVGFNVPGVRDSVVDGCTGLLADTDNEFVDEWIQLANDSDLRRTLADAAKKRASTFTWDRALDTFEMVLDRARNRA